MTPPPQTIESAVSRFDEKELLNVFYREFEEVGYAAIDSTYESVKNLFLTELTRAREEGRDETPANMRPHKRDCCELFNGCTCVGCECWEINREIVEAHLPKEEKGISR